MSYVFIEQAKRTPIGAFQGCFSALKAWELGADVIQAVSSNYTVDEVLMGCVLQAGQGQAPARQAAIKANLSNSVPCTTINKVCGSGMKAVMIGSDQILLGHQKCIVAGGMESMTNAPYILNKAREGLRFGHNKMLDHMLTDGLEDSFTKNSDGSQALMGLLTESISEKYAFTRDQQETFVEQTYANWKKAYENGHFTNEIVPITIENKHEQKLVELDEPPQKVVLEKFKNLKPAFKKDGTITAATSSSLADGAAALVLCSEENAQSPLARIVGYTTFAHEPAWFGLAPIYAIQNLCTRLNWSVQDVDLFEINEAFALVPMAAIKELSIPREKVNIHGGACVLGHPLGASGARTIVTLAHALKTYGLKRGIASTCIGSGEATAIALELC